MPVRIPAMHNGNEKKQSQVEALANEVTARLKAARAELEVKMLERDLTPANGWRIFEDLRHTVEGTQWTFRPMHLRDDIPELCTIVTIDQEGRLV